MQKSIFKFKDYQVESQFKSYKIAIEQAINLRMENSKLNEREQIKPINKTNKGESDLCKNSKMLYVRSKNDWKR